METANLTVSELKLDAGNTGEFSGYASVFDVAIPHQYFGVDVIRRGAFSKSLRDKGARKIKLLWQHDSSQPVGLWTQLREDAKGLFCKGQLLMDLAKGQEAYTLLRNHVVDGLSIGFTTNPAHTIVEREQRTITECDLWEISLVTFPAQTTARVSDVKSGPAQRVALLQDIRAARALVRGWSFPSRRLPSFRR